MEQERHKRRKCGPRVKTGCITCRIRRVKCDEEKPNCLRCVSTGRKCDGYVPSHKLNNQRSPLRPNDAVLDLVKRPVPAIGSPLDNSDDQRTRQLFHFYCVQSAFDLSVYLNSGFWQNMILQYSEHHPVVRQAVVAFGSSHMYALSMNQHKDTTEINTNGIEQARRYDLAIRSLREYMEGHPKPDPHVVLMCCALFFSCENARGNRNAAWQHLENGLHILKSIEARKSRKLLKNDMEVTGELELVASKNGSKLMAKTDKVDIDEELIYVFSRLDVQATLCQGTRKPVLNLEELSRPDSIDPLTHAITFSNITEAQRSLDFIHNRLARFLSIAATMQPQDMTPCTPEPDWIEMEKHELTILCENWKACMHSFIITQQPTVQQNLLSRNAPKLSDSPEWQLALQIQLLTLHHRCWYMLFRSYHNPAVFTRSPNSAAEEILNLCEFLGFALPLRPSAVYNMTELDISWKMISEISVTAPLFVLSTKCSDPIIRSRAFTQLNALRSYGNGMYHETFLDQVIQAALNASSELIQSSHDAWYGPDLALKQPVKLTTPIDDHDLAVDETLIGTDFIYLDLAKHELETGSLLGWSKSTSSG